ncbi:MAG TPA: nitroreductase family deazaflavin-dependent oxidoreductase [Anaerolineales bacterium]|nr:nitroreductase family deazaflavin-dependent oxidoreductase [Anaerolineales bacterium]
MDIEKIENALQTDRLVDITTTGRKSGEPHRIEITFHYLDGTIYISGMPGRRDWFANLLADPQFTFHLKQSAQADLAATARPITEPAERRAVLTRVVERWNRQGQLEQFIEDSPLIEVLVEGTGYG